MGKCLVPRYDTPVPTSSAAQVEQRLLQRQESTKVRKASMSEPPTDDGGAEAAEAAKAAVKELVGDKARTVAQKLADLHEVRA